MPELDGEELDALVQEATVDTVDAYGCSPADSSLTLGPPTGRAWVTPCLPGPARARHVGE
jgi:hypothetical protein